MGLPFVVGPRKFLLGAEGRKDLAALVPVDPIVVVVVVLIVVVVVLVVRIVVVVVTAHHQGRQHQQPRPSPKKSNHGPGRNSHAGGMVGDVCECVRV